MDKITSICSGLALFTIISVSVGTGCSGSDEETLPESQVGSVREVLITYFDSLLSIGCDPELDFPYDARGPGSPGTVTYSGNGIGNLYFPGDKMPVRRLYPLGEGFPVYAELQPTDMTGTIDFCTGQVELTWLYPVEWVAFGQTLVSVTVVNELTTGRAAGDCREATGHPMDEWGDLLMAGVTMLPETGNPIIDLILSLPTEALTEIQAHLNFPQGRFPCDGRL